MGNKTIYHIIAIVTAAIWGTTFISSKILLEHGLSPAEIMILRFAMAYLCMLPFWRGGLLAKSWRDELKADAEVLELLTLMVADITPEYDTKLQTLFDLISKKVENPINEGNKKILIFSKLIFIKIFYNIKEC